MPPDSTIIAVDGRTPGNRGLATRRRLLAATEASLGEHGYRELRVVDIARVAGTSPATFYQYFPDVDSALLSLAIELAETGGAELRTLVTDATWDTDVEAAASGVAGGVLDFFARHRAIIRVIDHASLDGDQRFRAQRTKLLNGIYRALAEVIARRPTPPVSADAGAGVLVSMLSHVAAHHEGLVDSGIPTHELRGTLATVLEWAIGNPP